MRTGAPTPNKMNTTILITDHTKQAAIMLMTGHTPKSRLSQNQSKKSPSFVVKKPSPVRKSSGRRARRSGRGSRETGDGITPRRATTYSHDTRGSKRASGNNSVSFFYIIAPASTPPIITQGAV